LALLAGPWAHLIFRFFHRLGPLGLLLFSTLDSSFLFLPFGNDLLLIALVSSSGRRGEWVLFVAMSALGSVIGTLLVDLVMRRAGENGLKRFASTKRSAKLKTRMEHNAGWALFLATVIPPPFPFTSVIMTAAVLQVARKKLLGTVFLGRLVRFSLEALLAIYFGRTFLQYMNSEIVAYLVYAFIVVAAVGSFFSLLKWLRH